MQRVLLTGKSSNKQPFRQLLATLLLLVFANVNYVVDTHIHGDFTPSHGSAAGILLSAPSPAGPSDADGQCPLCQAFLTAGFFLLPGVPVLALPIAIAMAGPGFSMELIIRALAHSWQGRGPPALAA